MSQKTGNELKGTITVYLFQSDNFSIAKFKTDKGAETVIKGDLHGISPAEVIKVFGVWENHPKYGLQLSVQRWERPIPSTKEQIVKFLTSPLVKGCGEKRAEAIVDKLGEEAIEIINRDGEKALDGIKGIGEKFKKSITESIRTTFEVQKVAKELSEFGITTNIAIQIYKAYESDSVEIIKKNPYRLFSLNLMSFHKVDDLALNQMNKNYFSLSRIEACINYVLKRECHRGGHSYISEKILIQEVIKELNINQPNDKQVNQDDVEQGIYHLLEKKRVIWEGDRVYHNALFQYEDRAARKLSSMNRKITKGKINITEQDLMNYQKNNQIILSEKQKEGVQSVFENQVTVLTGGPGTGKTTLLKAIIEMYQKKVKKPRITLVAPTGRASKKLSEVTGLDASTIHRAIGIKKVGEEPEFHRRNHLKSDFVIVDEMSMTDIQLLSLLLDAVSYKTRLLFVGDIDQLPSVNPGNVLMDLITAGIPTIQLEEVFRQNENSQIIQNAHRMNRGESLSIDHSKGDFYMIERSNDLAIASTILQSFKRFIELGYSISDILVLSPMKAGEVGTEQLNLRLREELNPKRLKKREIKIGEKIFREGDKVIETENDADRDVYNGDIGVVKKIVADSSKSEKSDIVLHCDYSGRLITYTKEQLKSLELAYAITIHKSQGGETPILIMPVTMRHKSMLARNLYYTAITRAKEVVVLVGDYNALNYAIQNQTKGTRNSSLDEMLLEYRKKLERYA